MVIVRTYMKKNNIFTVQVMKIKCVLNGNQNTDCVCVLCDWPPPEDVPHNELLGSPAD